LRRTDREIDDILNRATVCHLGMCDRGLPYVVPLNYGYADGCLYMHCARQGRKIDILRANNLVSFTVYVDERLAESDAACKWTMKYRSVMGTGRATLIEAENEKEKALSIVMRHYSEAEYTFDKQLVDRMTIIRVQIDEVSGKKSI
jgi:nitroimidazol reductase NimA-like FMN-containing flavoprotein (pyridoxamine 5'-phosphate oxidase superfamily)